MRLLRLIDHSDAGNYRLVFLGYGAVTVRYRGILADGVHYLHAAEHLAKGRVLAVQMRRVCVHDEKLAAGAVIGAGTRHGQHAARVLEGIVHVVGRELAFDLIFRAAGAVAQRIAALNHKAGDDAVEGQAIVEALIDKVDEVGHGNRGGIGIQLGGDRAVVLYVDLRVVGAVQQPVVGCIFMLSAKQQYACDDQRGDEDGGDDNQRPVGFLFRLLCIGIDFLPP